jgi:hypothetical protein
MKKIINKIIFWWQDKKLKRSVKKLKKLWFVVELSMEKQKYPRWKKKQVREDIIKNFPTTMGE